MKTFKRDFPKPHDKMRPELSLLDKGFTNKWLRQEWEFRFGATQIPLLAEQGIVRHYL